MNSLCVSLRSTWKQTAGFPSAYLPSQCKLTPSSQELFVRANAKKRTVTRSGFEFRSREDESSPSLFRDRIPAVLDIENERSPRGLKKLEDAVQLGKSRWKRSKDTLLNADVA